jgi:hypothetical protein
VLGVIQKLADAVTILLMMKAIKLLFENWIYPAVFVIRNKSSNRSKNDQEAGMWLWPTCLKWKSKAIRLVSNVARHVHRISYTRRWWGDKSLSSDGLFLLESGLRISSHALPKPSSNLWLVGGTPHSASKVYMPKLSCYANEANLPKAIMKNKGRMKFQKLYGPVPLWVRAMEQKIGYRSSELERTHWKKVCRSMFAG